MAGTLVADTLKSSTANPPVFQNTSGVEIGQLCRAWVNFNGVTTATIRASYNVSSVTRNSTGNYTVNFINAMADANYARFITQQTETSSSSALTQFVSATVSAFRFITTDAAATLIDSPQINVGIFR